MIRVPLILEKSLAVLHRLNVDGTDDAIPVPGMASGYDDVLREPIVYDNERRGITVRREARVEYPAIRVPCQVEPLRTEDLQQFPPGNSPKSDILLVLHRQDLERLKLLDSETNQLLIKENDRISAIESFRKPNVPTYHMRAPGLYVFQIQPRSFGFGPKGTDLFLLFVSERAKAR